MLQADIASSLVVIRPSPRRFKGDSLKSATGLTTSARALQGRHLLKYSCPALTYISQANNMKQKDILKTHGVSWSLFWLGFEKQSQEGIIIYCYNSYSIFVYNDENFTEI